MFLLQMLTVIPLTVILLASVEGRTPPYLLCVCVCVCVCVAWLACTLQVDSVAKRTMPKTKGRKGDRGMAAAEGM